VPVTLCGEMAGDPLCAMALIGLGYRSISMAPSAVGAIKEMILNLDREALERFMASNLDRPCHTLRNDLIAFARARRGNLTHPP
jgi:phosphotransferase system, enzyme I, PtsP